MRYTCRYESPLGGILLACDEVGLTGLWFQGQKYFAQGLDTNHEEKNTAVFDRTKKWLDIYFGGKAPDFTPPLHLIGSDFRTGVWKLLLEIPYGQVETYGGIAKKLSKRTASAARAVGGAVGHNKISIIIPCHRVVGANGSLTGYAGGIERKTFLLRLEKAEMIAIKNLDTETPMC